VNPLSGKKEEKGRRDHDPLRLSEKEKTTEFFSPMKGKEKKKKDGERSVFFQKG